MNNDTPVRATYDHTTARWIELNNETGPPSVQETSNNMTKPPNNTLSQKGDNTLPVQELMEQTCKLITEALNTVGGCENIEIRYINIPHAILNPLGENHEFLIRRVKEPL